MQSRNQICYENNPKAKETYIQMNGKEVFTFAVSKVPEAVKELLSREQVPVGISAIIFSTRQTSGSSVLRQGGWAKTFPGFP